MRGRIVQLVLIHLLALAPMWARGGSHVLLVDVSGSMNETISATDSRIRIEVVQSALQRYLDALPDGSRVLLMSFNEGVLSRETLRLDTGAERDRANAWVNGLDEVSRAKGWTYLWTSLASALEAASAYAADETDGPVLVRALTDGEDTEDITTFEEVLQRFPLVDGQSVRGGLVLLGDIELQVAPVEGFVVIRDPEFEALFDPVIQWAPTPAIAGQSVTFFDNSDGRFQIYRWRLDGVLAGERKVWETTFETAGTYSVGLEVEGRAGGYGVAEVAVSVSEPQAPVAAFQALASEGGRPYQVGDRIRFIDDSRGPISQWRWAFGEDETSVARHPEYVPRVAGPLVVRLVVDGPHGTAQVEQTFTIGDGVAASVAWMGSRGQEAPPPSRLSFGAQPVAHVRNGLARHRAVPDFRATPRTGDTLAWTIDGPGAAAFELRAVEQDGPTETLSEPMRRGLGPGVYRVSVHPEASEGDSEARLRIWSSDRDSEGDEGLLYEGAIRLTVSSGDSGGGGSLIAVFVVLGVAALGAFIGRSRSRRSGSTSPGKPRAVQTPVAAVESGAETVTLELVPAGGSAATMASAGGARLYPLHEQGRIYFSKVDARRANAAVYDLEISGVWLEWRQGKVCLRRSVGRPKREWVAPGRAFVVSNDQCSHSLKIRLRKQS